MKRTRILGIAPYEGMRLLMMSVAEGMADVELTALEGDLEQGAALMDTVDEEDFDVIVSRGGTAELLRRKSTLPVIDIELSTYDLLRTIRLAQGSNNRYAVVGFPAITKNANVLCDILRYRIDVYTIHNESEARDVLRQLSAEACPMVLCDMITNSIAREFGIATLLINSGTESVENALRRAVEVNALYRPIREHERVLKAWTQRQSDEIVILDKQGEVIYRFNSGEATAAFLQRKEILVSSLLEEDKKTAMFSANGMRYEVKSGRMQVDKNVYIGCKLTEKPVRGGMEKYGIRFLSKEQVVDSYFNSFYGVALPGMIKQYTERLQGNQSFVIIGETGTGKNQMARMLYGYGKYKDRPLCLIDCALLQQKGMNYLFNHKSSPLTEIGITIHFQKVRCLSDEDFEQLFSMLKDVRFQKKNLMIFSFNPVYDTRDTRMTTLINWFGCNVIRLPKLCDLRESIPQLTSLYINSVNRTNGCDVVGIEPGGMERLKNYTWPDNYDQFRRVLQDLVVSASGHYITEDDVIAKLNTERTLYPDIDINSMAKLVEGKTLEEISLSVLQYVLAREHNNRSAAAASLGIGRSTLWRMMQKIDQNDGAEQ